MDPVSVVKTFLRGSVEVLGLDWRANLLSHLSALINRSEVRCARFRESLEGLGGKRGCWTERCGSDKLEGMGRPEGVDVVCSLLVRAGSPEKSPNRFFSPLGYSLIQTSAMTT